MRNSRLYCNMPEELFVLAEELEARPLHKSFRSLNEALQIGAPILVARYELVEMIDTELRVEKTEKEKPFKYEDFIRASSDTGGEQKKKGRRGHELSEVK